MAVRLGQALPSAGSVAALAATSATLRADLPRRTEASRREGRLIRVPIRIFALFAFRAANIAVVIANNANKKVAHQGLTTQRTAS